MPESKIVKEKKSIKTSKSLPIKRKKITTVKKKTKESNKKTVKKKETKKTVSRKKIKIPKKAKIEVRVIGGLIDKKERKEIAQEVAEEIEDEVEEVLEDVLGQEDDTKKSGIKKLGILINLGKKGKTDKKEVEKEIKPIINKKDPKKLEEKVGKIRTKDEQRSINLYRKIAFFFIFLVLILVVMVAYVSFVKLSIKVVPIKERISDKIVVTVYNSDKKDVDFSSRSYIEGAVERILIKEKKKYEATGAEVESSEMVGKVKIINTYTRNQPLSINTRLLSPDEKLFKIRKAINVPPGGEVEVEIFADKPSAEMAIEPTEFIIPGLRAGLQSKIYAKNEKKFEFKTKVKKFIQKQDIDNAIQDLRAALKQKVEDNFGGGYKGYDKIIYEIDQKFIEINIEEKVGDVVDNFEVEINTFLNLVGFKKGEIDMIANEKLISIIPNNKKVIKFNKDSIHYSLGNYNFEVGVATVEAVFSGVMALKEADDVIAKKKLIGLSKDQIRDYLENLNKFERFEIDFYPSFIKTAPALVDKIEIKIIDK